MPNNGPYPGTQAVQFVLSVEQVTQFVSAQGEQLPTLTP